MLNQKYDSGTLKINHTISHKINETFNKKFKCPKNIHILSVASWHFTKMQKKKDIYNCAV